LTMSFVALHNHSVFSFHAGVCTVKELVRRAKALAMPAIALTDTNRMSGLIRFYTECREQKIKPILGVELTEPKNSCDSIVLLAKNAEGYGDLCEIITARHIHADTFTFATIFSKPWPNLFFITATPDLLRLLSGMPNRGSVYGELINNSVPTRQQSKRLEVVARELQIPLVVSGNSFFLDREQWDTHKILVAIGLNSTLSRLRPQEYTPQNAFLKSHQEMQRLFPQHAEAIKNSALIADQCNVELNVGSWIMPQISAPGNQTPSQYLRKLALRGLEKNYGGKPTYERARQIQSMELDVIDKLGYPSYFLIVKDIRDWANATLRTAYRKPTDCTILRGSAANSITFFNLGVSDLDPIRYDLYFQRFLNEDRASPPDADLDFGWDERERALEYLVNKWGRDRVAITCTTNHFRRRAAFREVGKVFGYSEEQLTEILKSHKTISRRIEDDEIAHLLRLSAAITGKPRFLGQHPGGVLITNQPIRRHVACEYSGGERNRIITQIDMHNGIDELGLIKFDILGNGSLSVLRDTLAQLMQQGLPDPNVADLNKCYNDPAVRALMRKGRTKGIFYIESPAQTRLNKKAQAETFEEITITSSLVRPAGAAYTRVFVERHRKSKLGIFDWEYLHPSLAPILKESHDVCAFQEDVTKICHQVAGLSYKDADKIRKLMNSQHDGLLTDDEYAQTAGRFMDGCRRVSGLTQPQALMLWERVSSFTGFSFCKSHSASYAQLSFKCTYLKAHYPAQFLAAVISNNHGFYSRDVYLDEARRWGLRILPMSINESRIAYWGKHTWIRPGFMHISRIGQKSLTALMAARERCGPFRNLADFVKRVPMQKKEIESLILVGALDGFGLTQPQSLFLLDDIYKRCGGGELFAASGRPSADHGYAVIDDYSHAEKCFNELRLLGYMISGDILEILDLHPASRNAVAADQIHAFSGRRVKVFGRMITNRPHTVEGGRSMLFVTLEDKTESLDVVVWPDIYQKYCDVLLEPGPFEIWGRVSEEWGAFTLEADRISAAGWSPAQVDFEKASQRLQRSFTKDYTYADLRAAA
ncbi:MAG: DNA polymerase III subunit alpha, partial [Chitinivibrionales bacterium]|nr:DNA polymerase III subunit alpha [Chitinivibrionales bacterium]